jgi:hypothetical protein
VSLTADAILKLSAMGLTIEQIADVARANVEAPVVHESDDARKKRLAAERAAAYRVRKRDENVTKSRSCVTGDGVTKRDEITLQRDEITPLARVEDNLLTTVVSGLAAVDVEARDPGDWPMGDANVWASCLVEAASTSRLDPSRTPGLITTLGCLVRWKRGGASWQFDVLPIVTSICRKRGPPISTWTYFDKPIAQSVADNRKALEIPEASHERPKPSDKRAAREDNLGRGFRVAMAVAGS